MPYARVQEVLAKKACIRYYGGPASTGKAGCTFKHIIVQHSISANF
jgi:hypothetical protein